MNTLDYKIEPVLPYCRNLSEEIRNSYPFLWVLKHVQAVFIQHKTSQELNVCRPKKQQTRQRNYLVVHYKTVHVESAHLVVCAGWL